MDHPLSSTRQKQANLSVFTALINELPTHRSLSCSRYLQSVRNYSQSSPQGYCLLPCCSHRMGAAYWVHRLVCSQRTTPNFWFLSWLCRDERSAAARNHPVWFRSCGFKCRGRYVNFPLHWEFLRGAQIRGNILQSDGTMSQKEWNTEWAKRQAGGGRNVMMSHDHKGKKIKTS